MASVPTIEEIRAFALRDGLDKLSQEQLARMAELAVYVGELGRTMSRPPRKEDPPAAAYDPISRRGRSVGVE